MILRSMWTVKLEKERAWNLHLQIKKKVLSNYLGNLKRMINKFLRFNVYASV